MSAAVTVEGLTHVYPEGGGIRDICLAAEDRAVTAVIGPNGAGKTVLFSILAGLVSGASGTVTLTPRHARVAYCPDVPQFESWLTALEVVEASLAIASERPSRALAADEAIAASRAIATDRAVGTSRAIPTSRAGARDLAAQALQACGLEAVRHRRVADFSRGMLQRLGIAAALVTDPEVLILDEPNSALDPIGRADVRRIITEQKQQRCILLSSHLLSEVEQLADHIVVLDAGRVVTQGATASVLTEGLEPVWAVRLGAPAQISAAELARAVPEAGFEFEQDTLCLVRFASFTAAEAQLMTVLQLLGAPLIEVTLQERDLDASFARLVQEQEKA
jgi:ABC-2 type transport system ATP-binding protein